MKVALTDAIMPEAIRFARAAEGRMMRFGNEQGVD
jgi:hypothetical protein